MHRIFLIGGRGAGKTTVGRLLAINLGWTFVDVDDEIEREANKTVAEIFADSRDAGFRELESAALAQLIFKSHSVIATGGGVVLAVANRELLKKTGFVVWLTANPEVMHQRITDDPTTPNRRPNLTPLGGEAEMEFVVRQREQLYQEIADLTIDTTHLSPNQVVSAILAAC